MATGRIGVTPTLGVRWSLAPTGGTTALSGLDDNSVSLVYSVGYEQVYRNGVLLSRGNDYTATDGTTVTLIDATITGDIIEIFAQQLVPLTDAISKGQFTAKGTLLSATAASTPGVLGVGADGTVLTAASGEATGLEWAAIPAAGANYTLLNAGGTALTGAQTVTVSGISGADKILVYVDSASSASTAQITLRFNGDTGSNYAFFGADIQPPTVYSSDFITKNSTTSNTSLRLGIMNGVADVVAAGVVITGCNASGIKSVQSIGAVTATAPSSARHCFYNGYYTGSSAITSVSVFSTSGDLDAGTVYIYTSA